MSQMGPKRKERRLLLESRPDHLCLCGITKVLSFFEKKHFRRKPVHDSSPGPAIVYANRITRI